MRASGHGEEIDCRNKSENFPGPFAAARSGRPEGRPLVERGASPRRHQMWSEIDRRIPAALLILRFFLAVFLLQWSIEKLILPDAAERIARGFYGVTLPVQASYALGVAELVLSLALLLGLYRTISYGLALLVH